jgi:hypothetical protein
VSIQLVLSKSLILPLALLSFGRQTWVSDVPDALVNYTDIHASTNSLPPIDATDSIMRATVNQVPLDALWLGRTSFHSFAL